MLTHQRVLAAPDLRTPTPTRALVPWLPALGFLGIVAIRLLLSVVARATGFLEYNADGYARIVHAATWARAPYLEVSVWLPLQFWLVGSLLRIWNDLVIAPVVLNFTFSVLSAWLLALTAARLGGWRAGMVAGLLAAVFPWSVWFGLSGLVEAPFAAAVSAAAFGLAGWLRDGRSSHLWLAGASLLLSTGLRYEGWFYSVAFAGIVTWRTGLRHMLRPATLGPVMLSFVFPALWIVGNLAVAGDPFAFARTTSEITAAEGTHATLTTAERLVFYPTFFVALVWPVAVTAAGALLVHHRRREILLYASWVVGELIVLALVTSRFSGIGAGRDRYVMSNAILLLPLCALLVVTLWRRGGWGRLVSAVALTLLLWFSGATLLDRAHPYPEPATAQVATLLRAAWAEGRLPANLIVPMEVPAPGSDAAYNERYALEVLTNRAGQFVFVSDLSLFNRLVTDQAPTVWITDDRLRNEGRPQGFEQQQIGPYTLHWRPLPPELAVSGSREPGGQILVAGRGFQPGEVVGAWLTGADGRAWDLGQGRANSDGVLQQVFTLPAQLSRGAYTLSARGAETGSTGHIIIAVS